MFNQQVLFAFYTFEKDAIKTANKLNRIKTYSTTKAVVVRAKSGGYRVIIITDLEKNFIPKEIMYT